MQIAICDDDQDELSCISSILDTYREDRKASIAYHVFHSATEMLTTAKSGDYDLYILDVLMPAVNGMEAAGEIRSFDQDAEIVFLTSSPEFAVESYKYKAQNYLLKPARREQIFSLIDTLLEKRQKPNDSLCIRTKNGAARIIFERLAYLEVMGRQVYFHMADGSVRETTAPLSEFESILLRRPEFARTHRSYIVNLLQVAELTSEGITTLSQKKVPISRHNFIRVREAYVEQLFAKRSIK